MGAKEELLALGLKPLLWNEVVDAARSKLAPAERERFLRYHRNYVGYLSQDTLDRFYGFIFAHDLHLEVNGYRFARLEAILDTLLASVGTGLRILDVGAGSGVIATVLMKQLRPQAYILQDASRPVRDHLLSMGFPVLPHPIPARPPVAPFDLILCADSLGEINADDDGALRNPEKQEPGTLSDLIEERYGFAQKMEAWKPYLAQGGKVLLWEPIVHQQVWEAIGTRLKSAGWSAQRLGQTPRDTYLELTLSGA